MRCPSHSPPRPRNVATPLSAETPAPVRTATREARRSRSAARSSLASPPSGSQRIRLFRIQPGFVRDLPWLEDDRPPSDPRLPSPESDDGPDWISFAAGNDNPYFDFRQRGDPGGVGFARVSSQVQLLET